MGFGKIAVSVFAIGLSLSVARAEVNIATANYNPGTGEEITLVGPVQEPKSCIQNKGLLAWTMFGVITPKEMLCLEKELHVTKSTLERSIDANKRARAERMSAEKISERVAIKKRTEESSPSAPVANPNGSLEDSAKDCTQQSC